MWIKDLLIKKLAANSCQIFSRAKLDTNQTCSKTLGRSITRCAPVRGEKIHALRCTPLINLKKLKTEGHRRLESTNALASTTPKRKRYK
jgi:hypothetical protein